MEIVGPAVTRLPALESRKRLTGQTEHGRRSEVARQRDFEAVVLDTMLEVHLTALAQEEVRRELSAVEDTPERLAAIDKALEGLVEVGLITRVSGWLAPTSPAIRLGDWQEFVRHRVLLSRRRRRTS